MLKLLEFSGDPEPHSHDPRDDQVRALGVRAAVCADRGAACRALCGDSGRGAGWPSWRQIAWIIVAMVGARSCGDDDEPHHRLALRPRKSAHAHARPRNRSAFGRLRVGLRGRSRRGAGHCRMAIESSGVRTLPRRARRAVFLFLHQAVHVVVAPGAGILPGDVARGGVDRHRRLARRAHVDPLRRR